MEMVEIQGCANDAAYCNKDGKAIDQRAHGCWLRMCTTAATTGVSKSSMFNASSISGRFLLNFSSVLAFVLFTGYNIFGSFAPKGISSTHLVLVAVACFIVVVGVIRTFLHCSSLIPTPSAVGVSLSLYQNALLSTRWNLIDDPHRRWSFVRVSDLSL